MNDVVEPAWSAGVLLLIAAVGVLALLFLIMKVKMHAFLALILISIAVALAARIPVEEVVGTLTDGFGSTLANVASFFIIGIGVFFALGELGVATVIVGPLFIAILALIVVPPIIAFGVGGIEPAREAIRNLQSKGQEKAQEAKQQAGSKVREQVDQRSKQAGEQVSTTASDLRTVGEQLREQGKETPAKLADQAAERTEQLGSYLTESDADKILSDVEDFARKQPWAVVAGGLVLGFAASRFLKASSSQRYSQRSSGGGPSRSSADELGGGPAVTGSDTGSVANGYSAGMPPPTGDPVTAAPRTTPPTAPTV